MRAGRVKAPAELVRLARVHGIETSYVDAFDRHREVGPDTIVGVLRSLGEEISAPEDARRCLARLERERPPRDAASSERGAPVVVAWDGYLPEAVIEALRAAEGGELRFELEGGAETAVALPERAQEVTPLPYGLHRLRSFGVNDPTIVISAPRRARPLADRSWGVFAPTYALFDDRDAPSGDLGHLERLGAFAGGLGASYVATLPLLADFSSADHPKAAPNPYSPLTRLWWNEAYLDLNRLPEMKGLFEPTVQPPEPLSYSDVAAAGGFVRRHLAAAAERLLSRRGERRASFERFLRDRPEVGEYAAYRAAAESFGIARALWPTNWRYRPPSHTRDVPDDAMRAHIYAQWAMDSQLAEVAAACERSGTRLLLDLPIGSQPDGFDPWAFRSSFAGESAGENSVSVGAPPDRFFLAGQNWGFRPLHPDRERRAGYPVTRAALAHLCRHAGAIRIDHAMGLQRLWWIPDGAAPTDGAYVHYRSDELLAIACLEAWRYRCALVGEDLGTVDPALEELLAEHGLAGMSVAVFDLEARPGARLDPKPGGLACIDTHDTATFAGWFDGTDVEDRLDLGIVDESGAAGERKNREIARQSLVDRLFVDRDQAGEEPRAVEVHALLLEELGDSDAAMVLVTLEDLWAEHRPQNIPGSSRVRLNFMRRLGLGLPEIERRPEVRDVLLRLNEVRSRSDGYCDGEVG